MSAHKVKSLFQNVRVRGFDRLGIGSVLKYMTDLKAENNDEIGHYGQTLISWFTKYSSLRDFVLSLIGWFNIRINDLLLIIYLSMYEETKFLDNIYFE